MFYFIPMSRVPYHKPALSYVQQLQKLKDRGLKIRSEEKAIRLLEKLSYYRLSGYWYPFLLDKERHIFKENADFDTAFLLYKFDLDKCLSTLLYDTDCDEKFLRSFKSKYSNTFPPSWMTLELTTFGTLSTLYMGLRPGVPKREIAHHFGLDDKTFSSWLHTFVYLRNVCAHHSRLWNREMSIAPRLPLNPQKQWLESKVPIKNDRLYYAMSMMLYLLQTVDSKHQLVYRFRILLKKYPVIDIAAMGFPSNWENEPPRNVRFSLQQKMGFLFTFKAK